MSRYVTKKHGLIIGSSNWFFFYGNDQGVDEQKDSEYRAMVLSIKLHDRLFGNSQ